jgi:DtxR family Mn-dependent transcriptional regulator
VTSLAANELTSSLEDYLEAILFLVRQGRVARVRDIARLLGVGMPSVSSALRTLSKRKLVNYDPYELITLTDPGREAAERVAQRHNVLRRFLIDVLGVDPATAEANACRMEHGVDQDVLERLRRFAAYVQGCPGVVEGWSGESPDDYSQSRQIAAATDRPFSEDTTHVLSDDTV